MLKHSSTWLGTYSIFIYYVGREIVVAAPSQQDEYGAVHSVQKTNELQNSTLMPIMEGWAMNWSACCQLLNNTNTFKELLYKYTSEHKPYAHEHLHYMVLYTMKLLWCHLATERTQEELIVIVVFTFRQICVESEQTVNITKHIRNSPSQGTAIDIERPYQWRFNST